MALENNIVTLQIKTKFGVAPVKFEKIKDLGNNRFILYSQERLCIAYNESFKMWKITDIIDLLDVTTHNPGRYCEEVYSQV